MQYLSYDETLSALMEIALAAPMGYVYVNPTGDRAGETAALINCYYFDYETDEPSCIIGHLLHKLGITLERDRNSMYAGSILDYLRSEGLLTVSDKARDLILYTQSAQDRGVPWVKAVQDAADTASGL